VRAQPAEKRDWDLRKDMTMADKDTDIKKIKELIEIMKQNELLEIEIKHDDDKIVLKRCPPQSGQGGISTMPTFPLISTPTPVTTGTANINNMPAGQAPSHQENLVEIKSPIVGTFYATPSPDSEPYIEIGSSVSPQTVVCIIEAMKVMNEIKAETSGTVTEILVTNGQAVEYGQVLFRLRPD
jgi:acetyl-CoA carboxylase biotin carboxyl carrier protein